MPHKHDDPMMAMAQQRMLLAFNGKTAIDKKEVVAFNPKSHSDIDTPTIPPCLAGVVWIRLYGTRECCAHEILVVAAL
jgi:hypothetical protein